MFEYKTRIFLHHTDASGRLFFANQFYLIHEAQEVFYESLGFPIKYIQEHSEITFPVVHAEADYKVILSIGDVIAIRVYVEKIGQTSVTLAFNIYRGEQLVGTGKTVSVMADKKTSQKMPIPVEYRKKIEKGVLKV